MGKLNGGEFLLDLTPITIEESTDSETYTNITNAKVLEQLTNLKRYIPNEKAIKPVWVKFVNDETDEIVVVKGELAKTSGDEEFEIHVKTKGYELTIHIEFTQAVNDNNDPIDDWYIDTNDAKWLFLSNTQVVGDAISGGDVPNAKPLYIHPIVIVDSPSSTRAINLAVFVFNNDETEFTTWAQLRTYIINIVDSLGESGIARFPTTGAFILESNTYVACHIYCQKVGENYSLRVEGTKGDGSGATGYLSIYSSTLSVYDGVNKLN